MITQTQNISLFDTLSKPSVYEYNGFTIFLDLIYYEKTNLTIYRGTPDNLQNLVYNEIIDLNTQDALDYAHYEIECFISEDKIEEF